MITRNRVVLVVSDDIFEYASQWLSAFEAIEEIDVREEAEDVWRRNKTPFMKESDVEARNDQSILKVQVHLIGKVEAFTEFCYANGFECGEYVTGIKYDTFKERCILCEIAHYKGMKSTMEFYNANVETRMDCIIYESESFYVVPELGSIKQGYIMIVPKEHVLSVAQFSDKLITEYAEVCEDIEELLKGAYGQYKPVVFFEHGSGPSGITSHKKSIVHAHTHVVVDFILSKKYQDMVCMEPIDDIRDAKETHYFSYQEGSKGQLMIAMKYDVYVQRQYPRQIMAMEYNLAPGQYNWRKVAFDENVDATLYNLHCYLRYGNPSERIRVRTQGFLKGFAQREDFVFFHK